VCCSSLSCSEQPPCPHVGQRSTGSPSANDSSELPRSGAPRPPLVLLLMEGGHRGAAAPEIYQIPALLLANLALVLFTLSFLLSGKGQLLPWPCPVSSEHPVLS